MAKQDRVRYKNEMDAYNFRKNARKLHQQGKEQSLVGNQYSGGGPFRPAEAARTVRYQVVPPVPGSPFSNVIPPAPTHESSQYLHVVKQPGMYYPPPYGMTFPQGPRGASAPTQQYGNSGRDTMASSNTYAAASGGEYSYR